MSEKPRLFLLDAMALIYRAYFAMSKNPRINSKGLNTSAILGFANSLMEIINKEKPSHLGVAFDTMAPTARHEEFTAYKANREAMPEELALSIPYIKQLIEGFNIPLLYVEGYEADDVIGTLAKRAEKENFQVFMVTPDKDFGQLVSENILMYKPARMGNGIEILGVKEICEKYNLQRPEQLIDILGLWGDASDNIPGIPGVGEVTAKKLIAEYGSIENLIANASDIKNQRMKEKVQEHAQQALLSKRLATIILDVPIDFEPQMLAYTGPNEEKLKPLFDELEFRTFAQRLFGAPEPVIPAPTIPKTSISNQPSLFDAFEEQEIQKARQIEQIQQHPGYKKVKDQDALQELAETLKKAKNFCFDTETTGLNPIEAELVGIAFAIETGSAWYVPVPAQREKALEVLEVFKPAFENPEIEKTGQNIKFDLGILKNYGIQVNGRLFDTMIAHYLLQPDMRHNMDVLAQTYLNYTPVPIEELIGKKGRDQKNMRQVNEDLVTAYACEDADVTLQLRQVFEPMLAQQGLVDLFYTVETPLIEVLMEMEHQGVALDVQALKDYSKELEKRILEMEQEIYQQADIKFNIASPKQLGEVLFDKLKIVDKAKKTKTKQYSTGEEILSKLIHKHPIIQMILDYRSLTKLKSTYVDPLPELIIKSSGRIHTSYNQAVAATGRLSSNNPNLQNIPIRSEDGREIRKAFVPRNEDYILLAADYSQIELRIIAALSKDKAMLEAFHHKLDIHTATASKVYGVKLEEVTKEMRRNAKTVNFGIVYGISGFGLADRLNIPRREAEELISQYFNTYPAVKAYMDKTIDFAREHGYVETILGRRRQIKDINSGNGLMRGYAERNAINAPIQGSAADMIKLAMIHIHQALESKQLKSRMIMQVHDELVFDVYKPELDLIKPLVEDLMKNAMPLDVSIEVDMNTGLNWLEAH